MQHFNPAILEAHAAFDNFWANKSVEVTTLEDVAAYEALQADLLAAEMPPVESFTVECEDLLEMPRRERHAHFKACSKARDISRRSARAAKRASSYIA